MSERLQVGLHARLGLPVASAIGAKVLTLITQGAATWLYIHTAEGQVPHVVFTASSAAAPAE